MAKQSESTKKKISWKLERRKKYSKKADKSEKPEPGTRKKFWVPAYEREGKRIKGGYRKNPNYTKSTKKTAKNKERVVSARSDLDYFPAIHHENKREIRPKEEIKERPPERKSTLLKDIAPKEEDLSSKPDKIPKKPPEEMKKSYTIEATGVTAHIDITSKKGDFIRNYIITIPKISKPTKIILDRIRQEFITTTELGKKEAEKGFAVEKNIEEKFKKDIDKLIHKYFPDVDEEVFRILRGWLIQRSIGMGDIEFLLNDEFLEEIVLNNANENVHVYHKAFGWLNTNISIEDETVIRHYATMIGRDVGKDINLLNPLLDAHLETGDRVNSVLHPIATKGNNITIRKFARSPWTIVDFLKDGTIHPSTAAFVWLAVQHEISTLIAGGTGSGKTSTLNVLANFFPPNQRIISIEDTRELLLPDSLHWVPMETRLPNPEGKGGISMLDLVVNSLRMRPDRILVGEIRRKAEAEVLFEAMQTGHSVCGTIHANNAEETIRRLTNPPIDVPKMVLPSLSMIMVQNRNRRTNIRRTLQLAEINSEGDANVFMELDVGKDTMKTTQVPSKIYKTLNLYTGMTEKEITANLEQKEKILNELVKHDIRNINHLGYIFAKYYTISNFRISDIKKYLEEIKSKKKQ